MTYALLYLLPIEIRKPLSGLRKAAMLLIRDQEGNQAMRHSPAASGLLTQLERQGAATWMNWLTPDFSSSRTHKDLEQFVVYR